MRRVLGEVGLGILFAMSLLVLAHMVVTLARLGWAIFFIPPGTLVRHIEWSDVSRLMWLFVGLVVVILLVTSRRWLEPGMPLARHWVAGALMIAIVVQACGASVGIADLARSADEAVRRMGIDEAELAALPPCERVRRLVRLSPYVTTHAGRPLTGGRILSSEVGMFAGSSTYDLADCAVREGLALLEQADRNRRDDRAWWAAQVLSDFLVNMYWRYDYLARTGDYSKQEPKPDLSYPEAQRFLHAMSCPPAYPAYGLLWEMYYQSRFGQPIPAELSYEEEWALVCGEGEPIR